MSAELPPPPVPADCDLRDFQFYQIDVARLRDSELMATADAEVFRCAVLSWCYAWHQLPAGSLPDDDATLSRAMGFGRDIKGWKKVRAAGGLRGWCKASDDRLYHPVVVEKVLAAWQRKMQQRWQTECARIKKHNQRNYTAIPCPDYDAWMSQGCPQGQPLPVPGDTPHPKCSKGQGQGQGQGQGDNPQPPPGPGPASASSSGPLDPGQDPQGSRIQVIRGPVPRKSLTDLTVTDLTVLVPALLVRSEDRDQAATLLALYGWDAMESVARSMGEDAKKNPDPRKRRVFVDQLANRLQADVTLAREDYERAGMPIPDGTPTQAELDAKPWPA
jgi:hypothetical protein